MGIAEFHGMLSESKLVSLAVLGMRSKMWPKFNQKSSNCYSLDAFIRIDVTYNDSDNRFRIGNNAVIMSSYLNDRHSIAVGAS